MPGASIRVSTSSIEKPARRRPARVEPMGPALARGVIFLIALAMPLLATLLSR